MHTDADTNYVRVQCCRGCRSVDQGGGPVHGRTEIRKENEHRTSNGILESDSGPTNCHRQGCWHLAHGTFRRVKVNHW